MTTMDFAFDRPAQKINRFVRRNGLLLGLSAAALGLFGLAAVPPVDVAPSVSSTVKVQLVAGHGSGVHIGDGLVLTAAHVASEGAAVTLKLDDGTTRSAEVVWSSKDNDVALLRTSPDGLGVSALNCGPVVIGQSVTARGNPLALEFITTYGHIVGKPLDVEHWKAVAPTDLTLLPGMSGGPLLNDAGQVVGINVAVMIAPMVSEFPIGGVYTGFGFFVPAQQICGLLGRH